jgi:hypothetical protein
MPGCQAWFAIDSDQEDNFLVKLESWKLGSVQFHRFVVWWALLESMTLLVAQRVALDL